MAYILVLFGIIGVPVCLIILLIQIMRKKRKIPVVKTMVGLFMCFVLGLILMPGSETVSKEASTYQAEQQKTEQSEQEKVRIQEEPPMESKQVSDLKAVQGSEDNSLDGEQTEQEDDNLHQIGEIVIYEGLEVTVKNYVFSNYIANVKGGAAPGSNNQWCVVYVDVRNPTKSAITLRTLFNSKYDFSLVYDNEYTYLPSFQNYNEFFEFHDEILPLETISATSSFELPNEVINSNKEIVVYFSKNKIDAEKVGWIIREDASKES